MSYPVKWTEYSTISNFVQNFYDALGVADFGKKFRHFLDGDTLIMTAEKGFAKEWLYYLGASNKRKCDGRYAGKFGEGFKIASLMSIRDYHLGIDMESRDWTLHVTSVPGEIDGHSVEFLAYEIGKRKYSEQTVLRISNITDKFKQELDLAMRSYFYEGNSLFGECLFRTNDCAVYVTNRDANGHTRLGCIFASYEKRGHLYVPLIICNHLYKPDEDDRDRLDLSSSQKKECIDQVFRKLDPQTSLVILEHLRKVWQGKDRKGLFAMKWISALRILIFKISSDPAVLSEFQKKYGDHFLIKDTEAEEPDPNKRKMAMEWFHSSGIHSQFHFLPRLFLPLGVRTVCNLCEEMDGYTAERDPSKEEQEKIDILREAAGEVLGELLILEPWPQCRILLNAKAPYAGYTKIKKTRGLSNCFGLRVAAKADYVYVQSWVLQNAGFANAFTIYAHELLHQYGGDTTLSFHRALSIMNQKIIEKIDRFSDYQEKWKS